MSENEKRGATTTPDAENPGEKGKSTNEQHADDRAPYYDFAVGSFPPITVKPGGQITKRQAKLIRKAELSALYQQKHDEEVMQNTEKLADFAEQATETVPSAAEPVKAIIAAYAASAAKRLHDMRW